MYSTSLASGSTYLTLLILNNTIGSHTSLVILQMNPTTLLLLWTPPPTQQPTTIPFNLAPLYPICYKKYGRQILLTAPCGWVSGIYCMSFTGVTSTWKIYACSPIWCLPHQTPNLSFTSTLSSQWAGSIHQTSYVPYQKHLLMWPISPSYQKPPTPSQFTPQ